MTDWGRFCCFEVTGHLSRHLKRDSGTGFRAHQWTADGLVVIANAGPKAIVDGRMADGETSIPRPYLSGRRSRERDFVDQLSGHGVGESAEVDDLQRESVRTADHILAIVVWQPSRRMSVQIEESSRFPASFLVDDGEAIDCDALRNCAVARRRHWFAGVVGAVAGHVDDPSRGCYAARSELCDRKIDAVANCRPSREGTWSGKQRFGELRCVLLVPDDRPLDNNYLLTGSRPLYEA